MATATSVTIQVKVDGSQAGPAIDGINAKLGELGVKGSASIKQASGALGELGGHVGHNLDGVRLLNEEFGLRMPRALEHIIAKMPGLGTAISSAVNGLALVATYEVISRVGEALYKAFDMGGERARAMQEAMESSDLEMRRMNTSLDVQIDKLQQEQAKIEHKPFNGMKLVIDEAAQAAQTLSSKLDEINSKLSKEVLEPMAGSLPQRFLFGHGNTKYEQTMLKEHQKWLNQADTPQAQMSEEASFGNSLQTRLKELQEKRRNADPDVGVDYKNEIDAINVILAKRQEETKYIQHNIDLSKAQSDTEAARAKEEADKTAKAAADKAALQAREATQELSRLQREALEANMAGEALENQKRLDQIEEVRKKLTELHASQMQMRAAEDAIDAKYFSDQGQRILAQQNKTALAVERAQVEGMLPGADKIRAEHGLRLNEINTDSSLGPDEASAQRAAAQSQMNQSLKSLQDETDKKKESDEQKAAALHARILDQETAYAQSAAEAERRVRSTGLMAWVSDYHSAIAAIQAQDDAETQRLKARLTEEKLQGQEYDTEFARDKVNIDRKANAQIEAQNQEMSHQIASTLQSAFDDPAAFIKRQMQKMFFDIVAQWIEHLKLFKDIFGSTMGGLQMDGGQQRGGLQGGLMGRVLGRMSPRAGGIATGGAIQTQASGSSVGGGYVGDGSSGSSSSYAGTGGGYTASDGGSTAGSLVGTIASDAPGLVHDVSAARSSITAQQADTSNAAIPGGAVTAQSMASDAGLDAAGMHDEAGNAAGGVNASAPSVPQGNSAATDVGNAATVGMAGYEGYQATTEAYKSGTVSGMFKGALGDAMAGMAIGGMVGGPVGALVGAGIGAAVGLVAGGIGMMMGEGGRLAARDYYKKSIFPQIEAQRNGAGSSDFQQAISQVNRTASTGLDYMRMHWGGSAAQWVNDNYLLKEQKLADAELETRAKGGAQYVGMSAAQFHSGGEITGFGSLATSSNEGFVHGLLGEVMMNPSASSTHGAVLHAMNSGASATDVARMYLANSSSSGNSSASSTGGTTHQWTVNAVDTKGFESMLRNGGSRSVVKHVNSFASQYAGDGISG